MNLPRIWRERKCDPGEVCHSYRDTGMLPYISLLWKTKIFFETKCEKDKILPTSSVNTVVNQYKSAQWVKCCISFDKILKKAPSNSNDESIENTPLPILRNRKAI